MSEPHGLSTQVSFLGFTESPRPSGTGPSSPRSINRHTWHWPSSKILSCASAFFVSARLRVPGCTTNENMKESKSTSYCGDRRQECDGSVTVPYVEFCDLRQATRRGGHVGNKVGNEPRGIPVEVRCTKHQLFSK